jgi:hypothetical protein
VLDNVGVAGRTDDDDVFIERRNDVVDVALVDAAALVLDDVVLVEVAAPVVAEVGCARAAQRAPGSCGTGVDVGERGAVVTDVAVVVGVDVDVDALVESVGSRIATYGLLLSELPLPLFIVVGGALDVDDATPVPRARASVAANVCARCAYRSFEAKTESISMRYLSLSRCLSS